jgi:hypothetical protein
MPSKASPPTRILSLSHSLLDDSQQHFDRLWMIWCWTLCVSGRPHWIWTQVSTTDVMQSRAFVYRSVASLMCSMFWRVNSRRSLPD